LHRVLERPQTIYLGIDPTAPSLHVGHLLPLLTLHRFQSMGHTCILLLGGATAAIGDPSGKSTERVLMDPATIHANCTTLHNQVSKWFDMDRLKVLNNAEWLGSMNILDFFVNTGKNMRVSQMLARDSVKQRLASEQGISFTEFAYQALQAYDFCHLYRHHGCTLQASC
jgi:tyrosyl-tRNA synthetase